VACEDLSGSWVFKSNEKRRIKIMNTEYFQNYAIVNFYIETFEKTSEGIFFVDYYKKHYSGKLLMNYKYDNYYDAWKYKDIQTISFKFRKKEKIKQ
jgi:hypothetical protein